MMQIVIVLVHILHYGFMMVNFLGGMSVEQRLVVLHKISLVRMLVQSQSLIQIDIFDHDIVMTVLEVSGML